MKKEKAVVVISYAFFILACSGCATVRHAVPPQLINKAEVAGMPGVRAYWNQTDSPIQHSILESVKQEGKDDYPVTENGEKIYPTLYISGGAANGAYARDY